MKNVALYSTQSRQQKLWLEAPDRSFEKVYGTTLWRKS